MLRGYQYPWGFLRPQTYRCGSLGELTSCHFFGGLPLVVLAGWMAYTHAVAIVVARASPPLLVVLLLGVAILDEPSLLSCHSKGPVWCFLALGFSWSRLEVERHEG